MKELLINIIATLENIDVHGSRNLRAMIGCIDNLTKILDACNPRVTETKEADEQCES